LIAILGSLFGAAASKLARAASMLPMFFSAQSLKAVTGSSNERPSAVSS
jgi:hypothetical protein